MDLNDVKYAIKGKVGDIKMVKVYYTKRREQDHFFRKFQGYGISAEVMRREILSRGVRLIIFEIVTKEKAREFYVVTPEGFIENAEHWIDMSASYGPGGSDKQFICPLRKMSRVEDGWIKNILKE